VLGLHEHRVDLSPFSVHATGRAASVFTELAGASSFSAVCSHIASAAASAGAGSGNSIWVLTRCCAIGSLRMVRWFSQMPLRPNSSPREAPHSPIQP
jgi:hypothetical protein